MMIRSIVQSLGVLLLSQTIWAQSPNTSYLIDPDTIAFELTEFNNIVLEAILNEKDTLRLMLHTGINEISLTEEATLKLNSLAFENKDTVESWGGESESRYSLKNSLKMGEFHWKDKTIWESKYSGHNTDGKFGLDLFEGKIIELDFEHKYLVIHSSLPPKIESYDQLDIASENGLMFIKGSCIIEEKEYPNSFLLHSGFSGSILLDDAFVETNRVGDKLKVVKESVLKDSYGNELKTIHAILPRFQLNETQFLDVPIGFFEGSINRQKMSVLGGDIIKRFNIIFDLKNKKIYLKQNELLGLPYVSN